MQDEPPSLSIPSHPLSPHTHSSPLDSQTLQRLSWGDSAALSRTDSRDQITKFRGRLSPHAEPALSPAEDKQSQSCAWRIQGDISKWELSFMTKQIHGILFLQHLGWNCFKVSLGKINLLSNWLINRSHCIYINTVWIKGLLLIFLKHWLGPKHRPLYNSIG